MLKETLRGTVKGEQRMGGYKWGFWLGTLLLFFFQIL